MRHSRLGKHYSILVKEKVAIKKHLKNLRGYRKELYKILYKFIDLERQNYNPPPNIKTEILVSLNTVCQEIVEFEDEEKALIFNLDRLPLG